MSWKSYFWPPLKPEDKILARGSQWMKEGSIRNQLYEHVVKDKSDRDFLESDSSDNGKLTKAYWFAPKTYPHLKKAVEYGREADATLQRTKKHVNDEMHFAHDKILNPYSSQSQYNLHSLNIGGRAARKKRNNKSRKSSKVVKARKLKTRKKKYLLS